MQKRSVIKRITIIKMNVLVSVLVLTALVSLTLSAQATSDSRAVDRHTRSVSNSGNANSIEHNSSKMKTLDAEKRQVQEFLTAKNIFKSLVKLLFGNPDEINATSRSVLGVLNKVLDLLKNTFSQSKSRSSTARTIRDSAEDAAAASVSILQGYVKSVLSSDDKCIKRHLCQASREAVGSSRDGMGYVIASVGGYASSYLLDRNFSDRDPKAMKSFHEASVNGRSNYDCATLYPDCKEQ